MLETTLRAKPTDGTGAAVRKLQVFEGQRDRAIQNAKAVKCVRAIGQRSGEVSLRDRLLDGS